jgi:hypothetical protein
VYSGERVGRALMGFEFESDDLRAAFLALLRDTRRAYREVAPETLHRIMSS